MSEHCAGCAGTDAIGRPCRGRFYPEVARDAAVGRAVLDLEMLRRSEWDQSDDALTADEIDRLESIVDAAIKAALGDE